MRVLWRRVVAFGFRLLYNELAWLYDPVSWGVSLGKWRRWQRTARQFLPAQGQVLEVGCGPGHLLAELATDGYLVAGLDLSRPMLRQARHRLRRQGRGAALCRGRAETLPFAAQTFDAVVTTFPTAFVYDPAWIAQVARVLKPGGQVIVVEMASLQTGVPLSDAAGWLAKITGQAGPGPDLEQLLAEAGLRSRRETVEVDGSTAGLVVAER